MLSLVLGLDELNAVLSVFRHMHCRVNNVLIEYSPGIYDANGRWSEAPDWPKMLS